MPQQRSCQSRQRAVLASSGNHNFGISRAGQQLALVTLCNLDAVCQFISDGGGVESETKQDRRLSLFVQLFNFVELVEIEIVGRGDSEEAALV